MPTCVLYAPLLARYLCTRVCLLFAPIGKLLGKTRSFWRLVSVAPLAMANTALSSVGDWGDRALAFNPQVAVQKVYAPATDTGPGYHAAMGGSPSHPRQVVPASKASFVAGGYNRGVALAHLHRDGVGNVECVGGVLGEGFNEHLRTRDQEDLGILLDDYRDGIHALRNVSAEALAEWIPADPIAAAARLRRTLHPREVRNAVVCTEHVEFISSELTKWIANGVVEYLGTVAEVQAAEIMPAVFSPLTVEPTKRKC
jgi:hypothetical protein